MKPYLLIIFFFTGTFLGVLAQESQKKTQFSPECKVTFNFTNQRLLGSNGFGVGFYNAFFNPKRVNLITGLEYNVLFRNIIYFENDYAGSYHYIGIPVNARVNFGKKVKFFMEAGVFFDPFVIEKRKYTEYDHPSTDKRVFMYKPDFGCSGGVGLRIPVNKYEILLKGDYKWGMRNCFDHSRIASYNGYWRFGVGFKM